MARRQRARFSLPFRPGQGENTVVMTYMTGAGRPGVMAAEALIHAEEIDSP
jgi:hypothetical protein